MISKVTKYSKRFVAVENVHEHAPARWNKKGGVSTAGFSQLVEMKDESIKYR
jgi:hypothetical protein